MTDDMNLRELGVPGYIYLNIKAEDTKQNEAIHNAFRELSKIECKNDYTLALGKLLEYYQADAKFDMVWRALMVMEARLDEIEEQLKKKEVQPEQEDKGTF